MFEVGVASALQSSRTNPLLLMGLWLLRVVCCSYQNDKQTTHPQILIKEPLGENIVYKVTTIHSFGRQDETITWNKAPYKLVGISVLAVANEMIQLMHMLGLVAFASGELHLYCKPGTLIFWVSVVAADWCYITNFLAQVYFSWIFQFKSWFNLI